MASFEVKRSVTDIPKVRDLLTAVREFDDYVTGAHSVSAQCRREWAPVGEALEALSTKIDERDYPLPPPSKITVRWRQMEDDEIIPTGAICKWGHNGEPFSTTLYVGMTERVAQRLTGMAPDHAARLYIGEVIEPGWEGD